jgi:hypothetical protein
VLGTGSRYADRMERVPRHLAVALVCVVAIGCESSHQRVTDSAVDVGTCTTGTTVRWYDDGYCFEAPSCCLNADCGAGFVCSDHGRCMQEPRTCDCLTNVDCSGIGGDAWCLTNEVVCGTCRPPRPRCDARMACAASTDACEAGYCVDTTAACVALMPAHF